MRLLTISDEKLTLAQVFFGAGNGPSYSYPKNTADILNRLHKIEKLFKQDGIFNENFPEAEEYALCLLYDNKEKVAFELFNLIAGTSTKLLHKGKAGFEMTSNKAGQLGIEGLYQYAKLLKKNNQTDRALAIFCELVENYPFSAGIRGVDIAGAAVTEIIKNEAWPKGKKDFYKKQQAKIAQDSY